MLNFNKTILLIITINLFFINANCQRNKSSNIANYIIPKDSLVLVLPLYLTFEDIRTEDKLDPDLYNGKELKEVFYNVLISELKIKSIGIKHFDKEDSIHQKLHSIQKAD